MANPLPNEKELYQQIKKENISLSPDIWDLIYNRVGDDVTAINLLCQYYLNENSSIPIAEASKILNYTRHIKDITNKLTVLSNKDLDFPQFSDDIPLHPVLRELFTHYIGNDVYMINLIVDCSIDPKESSQISSDNIKKILYHTRSIKDFMNRLQEATSKENVPSSHKNVRVNNESFLGGEKNLTKARLFLKLQELFVDEFGVEYEKKIKLTSRFKEDLDLDSVDAIRAAMVLEEMLGLEIPDNDAESILTFSQAVDYVYNRLKQKP
jgi:acyl carrier protein